MVGLITPNSCNAVPNGAINLTFLNGTGPYIYSWSTGDTTQIATGLATGNHSVSVTDSCGNINIRDFYVNEISPPPITISSSITHSICFGNLDGQIDIILNNGTGPYSYLWSTGDTTQNLINIGPGNYDLTITDFCGDSALFSFTVNLTTPAISTNAIIDSVYCSGDSSGSVLVFPSGGTGGYSYLWSTGDTLNQITGQPAGVYTLTITDSCGYTQNETFEIINKNIIEDASFTYQNFVYSQFDPAALPIISGTPGGTFSTNSSGLALDSQIGEIDFCNSESGGYVVTYKTPGPQGCSETKDFSVWINPKPAFEFQASINQPDCPWDTTGAIQLSLSGGRSPYMTLWASGDTTLGLTGLPAGIYPLTMTDDCQNQIDTSIVVNSEFQQDDASFVYDSAEYCIGGFNPTPAINHSGFFTANSEDLVFADSLSGKINLQLSKIGDLHNYSYYRWKLP